MADSQHRDERAPARDEAARRTVGGVPLGRIFGIQIVADWSVLVIVALVATSLGLGTLPSWHPDWGPALTWGVAVGAAILFLVSILLHELSHSLVGKAMGIGVSRITLFIFGGMAHTETEPPSPKAELLMAAAGPAMSLGLGVGATALGVALSGVTFTEGEDPTEVLQQIGPVASLLLWLGPINVLLGLFNLVPGFPLDGGRVLRAILWAATGDLVKATKWSSWAGQGFAALLVALGIIQILGGDWGGLWLMLIGWFVRNAARAGYAQTVITEQLEDATVHDVMRRRVTPVAPDLTIAELVSEYLMQSDQKCFPVVGPEGRLTGLVCLEDVRRVPRERWAEARVADEMTPVERLHTIAESAPAVDALKALGAHDIDQVPVVDPEGMLRGWVRRQDIMRWLTLRSGRLPA